MDQTPWPDFDIGVLKDFSLPVVDLESSASLDWPRSRLDLVDCSACGSDLRVSPGSDGVAEAMLLVGATIGEFTPCERFDLPGRPMTPTGDAGGGNMGSIDDDRLRGTVHKSLNDASSSGRTSGIAS